LCRKEQAKEPFDLGAELFASREWRHVALGHPMTVAISRLKRVVDRIAEETAVHWIGIYRVVHPPSG